jgi:hypothetical protein
MFVSAFSDLGSDPKIINYINESKQQESHGVHIAWTDRRSASYDKHKTERILPNSCIPFFCDRGLYSDVSFLFWQV